MGLLRCGALVVTVLGLVGCDYLPSRKPSVADLERFAMAFSNEAEAIERLHRLRREVGDVITEDAASKTWLVAIRYRESACSGISEAV
jgi:hypothetical protein